CQYWGAKEECKFCDINENARQMKLSRDFTLKAPVKPVEDVVRVCEEVTSDARRLGVAAPGFVLSGGTITKTLHGKSEVDFYEEYIRAIKNIATKPRITFEVNARPRAEVQIGSGGTITKTLHGKSEVDFYEEYIRAIKNIATKPRITFEVNARPREEV